MLKLRQMIPPFAARGADGRTVRAGDFKQKKSLLIAFLHPDCPRCEGFLTRLAACGADLAEREAVALVIRASPPPLALPTLPREVIVATDLSGHAQQAFLGKDAFGTARQPSTAVVGVFVADRYGELMAQWQGSTDDALPALGDALSWLAQAQIACEECGAPERKLD